MLIFSNCRKHTLISHLQEVLNSTFPVYFLIGCPRQPNRIWMQCVASNWILDSFILCVLQRYTAEACKQMSLKLQFWVDSRCHTISTKLHFVVINLGQRSVPLQWSVIPWGRGTVELGKGWCVRLYPFEWKEKCLWAHEASECNTWVSSGERRWS